MSYKVVLLPGDGIGPEVTNAAVKILNLVAEKFKMDLNLSEHLIGGCSFDKYGTPLTDEVLNECYNSDAVFLGAVGGKKWESLEHNLKPEAALLKLRKSLELFTNIRPAKVYSSLLSSSPLKKEVVENTDFVVLRELTGDVYFGQPRGMNDDKGWNTMIYSKEEIVRIARSGFELAETREKKVTSVDKANVLESSQFWRKIVHEVHNDFPGIELNDMYVDNAAMQIVSNPNQFDVILTQNLFGDILSDIAAVITGSLGMLPSASLGNKYALYEPVHGSAPDIAGQNKANPLAAISSVAMMFNHSFEMNNAAQLINEAIEKTLNDGNRTADIYREGTKLVSTEEMTESVLNNINKIYEEESSEVLSGN